jgi:hypothetical protein
MNNNEILLYTDRLVLKNVKLENASSMFKYRSDPKICLYQNFKPKEIGDVEIFIKENVSKIVNVPDT